MQLTLKKTLTHLLTLLLFIFTTSIAYAGGGLVEMSSTAGQASGSPATVTATVFLDNAHTQPAVGVRGTITFQSAQAGQKCTSASEVTDSQGKITATCSSPMAGGFVAGFTSEGSDAQHSVAIYFSTISTPVPTPQTVSGQYKLESTESSISFSNQVDTGYGITVTLKDSKNGEVITDQSDIQYTWTVTNQAVAKVYETKSMCIGSVRPPCPTVNGQLYGYQPGTTTLKVEAKKGGQGIAEVHIAVTVTQTTSGTSRYTPTPTPSASPSSTPSTSPSPSPSVKPSPSPSPKATNSPSPTPGTSPTSQPTNTPKPTPTALDSGTSNSPGSNWGGILLLVGGILLGVGVPIGWYIASEHPEWVQTLKKKLRIFRE